MASVVIALPFQQQRRCFALMDSRFADAGSCSPVAVTPRLANPLWQGSEMLPSRPRYHMVMSTVAVPSNLADISPQSNKSNNDMAFTVPSNLADSTPQNNNGMQARRQTQRSKTLGAEPTSHCSVSVVAPGGGTGINSAVYAALARNEGFSVGIVGQSRAPYDRYPASWGHEGAPAPNLESFALDLARQGCFERTDCLVVGSRGGQVVLPTLWQVLGEEVPPAIVMNGGCAMGLPTPVNWPKGAVTFLMLGGNDNFRGNLSVEEYLVDAQRRVPEASATTAILLVHEMTHMPQAELLMAILMHMIRAATAWQSSDCAPLDEFQIILDNLRRGGWSGKLTYKTGAGTAWQNEAFP